jgi:tRNA pseudouridine13 synthase
MSAVRPRARGAAAASAQFRTRPEDFRVCELPAAEPSGDGEHLWLHVEKTGRSTPDVAGALAATFRVPEHAVGYAGMKDKHAVTRQWFSVHTEADPARAVSASAEAGLTVLSAARHRRKLRRGELAGNAFRLRLEGVVGSGWQEALADTRALGVPNYFGPQRFGTDNLAAAVDWLANRRRRRISAFRRGLHLSVLRSLLFNEVLGARVAADCWRRPLPGDVLAPPAMRGEAGPPVPTGPLWGRGRSAVGGAAAELERKALEPHRAVCEGLEHAGLSQERRSLVLRAPDLTWSREDDAVVLSFSLPPGAYATVLLAEAFELREPAGAPA